MKARGAWWQTGSECWKHCAVNNAKRSIHWRNDEKLTLYAKKRNLVELRIFWIARLLLQEHEFKMVRERLLQEQEDMRHGEKGRLTPGQPNKSFEEMMNAVRDRPSDVASSNNVEDGEDDAVDEQDTVQGAQSECDKPGRAMCTVSKTVQQHM
jgi:hypothetical protein